MAALCLQHCGARAVLQAELLAPLVVLQAELLAPLVVLPPGACRALPLQGVPRQPR
jgi:hypothetical protein